MPIWTIKSYLSEAGKDCFDLWYRTQAHGVKAQFRATLNQLRRERTWSETDYKDLEGDCEGLGEIRVKVAGKVYRAIGFKPLEKRKGRAFVILTCYLKESDDFYTIFCPEAHRRAKVVLEERKRTHVCLI